jgi:AraC-like DNA-binding protein
MMTQQPPPNNEDRGEARPYAETPLPELVDKLLAGDHQAHAELVAHRRCCRVGGQPLSLYECIQCFRAEAEQRGNDDPWVLEKAADLTVDKFHHWPRDESDNGPDCRYYFRAYQRYLQRRFDATGPGSALQREQVSEHLLQQLVARHFNLSVREVRRQGQPRMRAFTWRLATGALAVQVPARLNDEQADRWLSDRFGEEVDPSQPGEAARLQRRIDAELRPARTSSVDPVSAADAASVDPQTLPFDIEAQLNAGGLGATVAKEKAHQISRQRPAIRDLGRSNLEQLVRQIFQQLADENYRPAELASHYGLSKATLSRFAGMRWLNQANPQVPELWRNTARILAHDARFREATEAVGLWDRVASVAGVDPSEEQSV